MMSKLNTPRRLSAMAAMGLAAMTGAVHAVPQTLSYLRFTPKDVREHGNLMQISELLLYDASGNPIPVTNTELTSANTDTPAAESFASAFDGIAGVNPGTTNGNKWLDLSYQDTNLIIKFLDPEGTAGETREVTVGSYNFFTANDAPGRDPVSWIMESSMDGVNWEVIDVVDEFVPASARHALAAPTAREFPAELPPLLTTFEFFDFEFLPPVAVVPNGNLDFYVDADYYTDISISVSGGATVTANNMDFTTVPLLDNSDMNVTLTVTGEGGTIVKTLKVRTVDPVFRTVDQVRFTPIKMRGGADIQLSEFKFFDSTGAEVVPTNVVDALGTNAADAGEGALKLIDNDTQTKWYSGTAEPIVFEFGASVELGTYSFSTANDFNGRDPVQWLMEGSSDGGATWSYIDSMLGLNYSTPTARYAATQEFPLPADGTMMPYIKAFTINFGPVATVNPGETADLDWDVDLAGTLEILPQPGVVANSTDFAEVTVTADTVYTLTASASVGNRSTSAQVSAFLPLPFDGTLDYPDFDNGGGIIVNGSATIINDFAAFPNDPDAARLRITGLVNGQSGSAFFYEPIDLTDGFSTSFEAEITAGGLNGADELVFLIQNTTEGEFFIPSNGQVPDPGTSGPSVAVVIDTFQNEGDLGFSTVKIMVNGELLEQVDLSLFKEDIDLFYYDGPDGDFYDEAYFIQDGIGGGTGYDVQIDYYPGFLTVKMEGVTILDRISVDLGPEGAAVLDENGKAYVGFTGRTGGLSQNGDILSWSLTTEGIVPPDPLPNPLMLTDSSFDFSTTPATATLTWASTAGMLYDITTSATLAGWSPVMENVPATGTSTTVTIDLPEGTKGFFRVEEVVAPAP